MDALTCDTCKEPRHPPTDHEFSHLYTPEELLALGTEVWSWKIHCGACFTKYELTTEATTDTATDKPRFCVFCGTPFGEAEK